MCYLSSASAVNGRCIKSLWAHLHDGVCLREAWPNASTAALLFDAVLFNYCFLQSCKLTGVVQQTSITKGLI